MVKNENFFTIQGFMVNELKLKGNELLVYAIIYGFSQEENNRFAGSLQYLADWLSVSKQTVITSLKSLVDKGLIEKIEKEVRGVKLFEYRSKNLNTPFKKFEYPIQKIGPNIYNNNNLNNNNNIIVGPVNNGDKKVKIAEGEFFLCKGMKEYEDLTAPLNDDQCESIWKWICDKFYGQELSVKFIRNIILKFKKSTIC